MICKNVRWYKDACELMHDMYIDTFYLDNVNDTEYVQGVYKKMQSKFCV